MCFNVAYTIMKIMSEYGNLYDHFIFQKYTTLSNENYLDDKILHSQLVNISENPKLIALNYDTSDILVVNTNVFFKLGGFQNHH